jgi:hypothetical protein
MAFAHTVGSATNTTLRYAELKARQLGLATQMASIEFGLGYAEADARNKARNTVLLDAQRAKLAAMRAARAAAAEPPRQAEIRLLGGYSASA